PAGGGARRPVRAERAAGAAAAAVAAGGVGLRASGEAAERVGGAQGGIVGGEGAGTTGTGAPGLEPHGDAPVPGALHPAVPVLGVGGVVAGPPPTAGCRGRGRYAVDRRL